MVHIVGLEEDISEGLFSIMEEQFAALKIPDSESEHKLTRTSSFSGLPSVRSNFSGSPSARRILIQQHYRTNESSNLVRQYSCEQIFNQTTRISQVKFSQILHAGKKEPMKTWRRTVSDNNSWNIADRNASNKENISSSHKSSDSEINYMEVDDLDCGSHLLNSSIVSTNTSISSKESSLKYNEEFAKPSFPRQRTTKKSSMCDSENERNDNKSNNYHEIKNKIRPLVPKRSIKMENPCVSFKLFFLMLLATVVILVSILLHEDQNQKYNNDFTNAIVELRKRIHGQDQALRDLHEYLSLDAPLFKVIALAGGTGTGKTYTIEIIKRNFPRAQSIHQYFPPIMLTINDIALSILHPSLIILENLKEHDLPDVMKFLRSYQDLRNHQHITVLTVFNVEQIYNNLARIIDLDQSVMVIKNIFATESIDVKVISYESLSEDILIKCIVDAARDSNLILSDHQIDLVKQNLLINNAGCKGAYSKVQVIGRQ